LGCRLVLHFPVFFWYLGQCPGKLGISLAKVGHRGCSACSSWWAWPGLQGQLASWNWACLGSPGPSTNSPSLPSVSLIPYPQAPVLIIKLSSPTSLSIHPLSPTSLHLFTLNYYGHSPWCCPFATANEEIPISFGIDEFTNLCIYRLVNIFVQ
jgi:hypothetical protein